MTPSIRQHPTRRNDSPLRPPSALQGVAAGRAPASRPEVGRPNQIALERRLQRVRVSNHARAVQSGQRRGDLRDAAIEFGVVALRLIVAHLDFTNESASSTAKPDPPVRLTLLVP